MSSDSLSILPSTDQIDLMEKMAEKLAKSSLIPVAYKNQPASVFLAIQLGRELGLQPMQAINGINVIQGKASISPALMAAMVMNSGKGTYIVKKFTNEESEIDFIRNGERTTFRFTKDDAIKAGLMSKDNWRNWPKNMLYARNMANGARTIFPDVVQGLYTPEELSPDSRVDAVGQLIGEPATVAPAASRGEALKAELMGAALPAPEEAKKDATDEVPAVEAPIVETPSVDKMTDKTRKYLDNLGKGNKAQFDYLSDVVDKMTESEAQDWIAHIKGEGEWDAIPFLKRKVSK